MAMSPPQAVAQQPPSEILLLIAALLYTLTAVMTFVVSRAARTNPVQHHRRFERDWKRDNLFWIILGILLLLGAAYRALNIEFLIDSSFRSDLRADGLYATRHALQARFVIGGMLVGIAMVVGIDWRLRHRHPSIRLAAAAGIGLAALLGVRGVSAHAIDAALRVGIGGVRLGLLAEPAMLAVIAAAALWFRRWRLSLPTEIVSRKRSRS
jgi:hypothetical protein